MKCFIIYNKHEITTHVVAENTIIVQAYESDDIFTFKQLTARNTHVLKKSSQIRVPNSEEHKLYLNSNCSW